MPRLACTAFALTALAACAAPRPAIAQPAPARTARNLATEYRAWLDDGRTPADVIDFALSHATSFSRIDPITAPVEDVDPGDRLVFVSRGRAALWVVVGKQPLETAGAVMVGAHIDTPAPRLDLSRVARGDAKTPIAYSYGGIKPHHWLGRPLAVVGRAVRTNGQQVEISLGLYGHGHPVWLSSYNRRDRAFHVITGGGDKAGKAAKAGKGKKRKAPLIAAIGQHFSLTPADLVASELYLVPVMSAREVGFGKQLIGAHGQDDRLNSYAAWRAIADLRGTPPRTAMVWLVDREEVGSTGPAGAQAEFLELCYAYLLRAAGGPVTEARLRRALASTEALSADTPPVENPLWPEVMEPSIAPEIGRGIVVFPHTGVGGKIGGSQARAELTAQILALADALDVPLQVGELGRVDEGGGGTIAKYLGHRGIDVIDVGAPVMSMHSPFELSSKDDLFAAYRMYRGWLDRNQARPAGGNP